jgi:Trk-type K+ transport system membrane component
LQEEQQVNAVTLFLSTYFVLILLATLTSTMYGLDLLTAFSSSVSFIGNIGPGFGEVGSYDNYAAMPLMLKIQGTVLMLMYRECYIAVWAASRVATLRTLHVWCISTPILEEYHLFATR